MASKQALLLLTRRSLSQRNGASRALPFCIGQTKQAAARQVCSNRSTFADAASMRAIACNRRNIHTTVTLYAGKAEAQQHVFNVQDVEDFKNNVLKSDKPVIVDFYATWCGPCKILGPRLEKIIGTKGGDVVMAKIDIDNPDLDDITSQYKVSAVPTVVAIVNGKPVDQFSGARDEDQIEMFVDKAIGKV